MRKLIAAAVTLPFAATLALSTPAAAGTVEEIVAHGMIINLGGTDIEVIFTPDGKYTAAGGQITGDWKIDGAKLCTSSNLDPNMTCVEYPKDKKSGDTFDLVTPQGTAPIKIK